MNGNVLKFGGTSLGDATALIKAAAIVKGDENARAVVVSAPGKRHFSDKKIMMILKINAEQLKLLRSRLQERRAAATAD